MRRYVIPIAIGLALLGVAACSPDAGDFAGEAEDFIEEEDGDVAQNVGETFTDATCEDPASTDEGATFACSATASDGSTWQFEGEITGSNSFLVTAIPPTGGAGGTGGTTPPGTATTAASTTTASG